jgi:ribokinase
MTYPSGVRARPSLVSLGDLVLDIVVRPQASLLRGSDTPGSIGFRAGGSAANTCRAFVGLGGSAIFIGALGRDAWGRRLVRSLRNDGVRLRTTAVEAPTARLLALIGPRGERSFVTERGAANKLDQSHIRRSWLTGADFLHLPAYSLLNEPLAGAAAAAAGYARAAGALVSVDLASRGPLLAAGRRTVRARLREVGPDLLFANADEARTLAGRHGESSLLALSPVLVVKEGAAGCRVLWSPPSTPADRLELDIATTPVETLDTTGAGDAFDAGFLYSLAEQRPGSRRGRSGEAYAEARSQDLRRAQLLRRAAVAGHRAAASWLSRARPVLAI